MSMGFRDCRTQQPMGKCPCTSLFLLQKRLVIWDGPGIIMKAFRKTRFPDTEVSVVSYSLVLPKRGSHETLYNHRAFV